MIGRFRWNLQLVLRKVWVRALAYGLLGIVTALAAVAVRPFLPADLGARIGADAVDQILGIIASSMLAVTTFSLSIMVTAFGGVTTTATPRAIELLKQDATTQKVLATFIGAFLFALVGIVALKTGVYGDRGRLVLFVATIAVLSAVVLALLRWIAHLMDFGRLSDTLGRVEAAATAALRSRMAMPYLGGHPLRGAPPVTSPPLLAHTTGYVQHIDMAQLSALADIAGREMYLAALPGTFVHPAAPLLHVAGLDDDLADKARSAFSIGEGRTYDQDPRFGVIALTEAASRALSPAVNDPGTAIEVIGRLVRVLSEWTDPAEAEVVWPRLHVPPIRSDDLIEDAFRPIARDGASLIEVQIRLQKALLALAEMAPQVFAPQTARASADALARVAAAGLLPDEIATLRALSDRVAALTEGQPRRATL